MSYAPQSLLDARAYLQGRTGLPWVSLGIVGDTGHRTGYHLGRDRIYGPDGLGDRDYSVRTGRDRAGLTDAAAALDVGLFGGLVALTGHLLGEARAGRAPDVRELIGPAPDGRAYRWEHEDGWTPRLRVRGDSHETHLHVSFYRDAEHRDKVSVFRSYFEPEDDDVSVEDVQVGMVRLWDDAAKRDEQIGRNAGDAFARFRDRYLRPMVQAELAEVEGQVAGLTELVGRLLGAPPVPVTDEQLAELVAAVRAGAADGAQSGAARVEAALAAAGAELAELAGDEPA